MKEFLKKMLVAVLLCMLALSIFCLLVFIFILPQYSMEYTGAILDKIQRLESIDEPKIILVGHSNLVFGMDSAMLEEAMDMPVVNLGFHGGLSNEFHEEVAKYNINNGDIVVLCHSDYGSQYCTNLEYPLAWITIENHFKLWPLISQDEWPKMISLFPNYIHRALNNWKQEWNFNNNDKIYSRSAFNKYGDNGHERTESFFKWTEGSCPVFSVDAIAINRINEFTAYCQDKGAFLVIAGYPIGDGDVTPEHKLFIENWEKLRASVKCSVISDIEDYFFDYSLFYDTYLHLTTEGARIRTEQLIEDLSTWRASLSEINLS